MVHQRRVLRLQLLVHLLAALYVYDIIHNVHFIQEGDACQPYQIRNFTIRVDNLAPTA